ncbi:hypothetical protein SAMN02745121_03553 [Nannocystis exedens]|uniref:MORN repeat-containing protein n=1 Tax=Nannocystis exedens TaxID=54 RepID=A0A1I1YV76_9BACT|nr:hypothetical protein [Nannocystis exedens]PCC70126.1 hypothetical protein NAEX_03159 [Nannocystis exedens]SFE23212.1 hypothetical protein SAMN02745121_03553 [Nannocystis exedens]
MRLDRWFLGLIGATVLSLPALAAEPAPCPDGASWHGQAPPHGSGYFCGKTRPDGEVVRHGWGVVYHPVSGVKVEECEYRDGARDGRCTFFDERGDRSERGTYAAGVRAGQWWYWSLPSAQGRVYELGLATGAPEDAVARRKVVEGFLSELGAEAKEAAGLAEAVLSYVDKGGERRQVCGPHLCVGPGRIPSEPIFVDLGATVEQAQRDRKLLAQHEANARVRAREEARAVRAAQAKAEAEQRRVERELEQEEPDGCCKYCSTGKPCGNTCIARNKTCHKGPGCACWSD